MASFGSPEAHNLFFRDLGLPHAAVPWSTVPMDALPQLERAPAVAVVAGVFLTMTAAAFVLRRHRTPRCARTRVDTLAVTSSVDDGNTEHPLDAPDIARPPIALGRLIALPHGKIEYRIKKFVMVDRSFAS